MEHRPYELSGGEQQRVALARCLINRPELILADEPTGNLDTRTGLEVLELLLSLGPERGTTLVVATHDSKVADRAGRVVVLEDGRVVGAIAVDQ
jgi:predicted ABC-type transport system involved in lysophospholipase L1 biosynthesis ATPase subunit